MLAASTVQHMPCSQRALLNRSWAGNGASLNRRNICTAASHAAAGACDHAIVTALQKYGDHAKAAYVLHGRFCDNRTQPADIDIKGLRGAVEKDSKGYPKDALPPFPGLEGYTGVANIKGYPGRAGVFTVPTPIIPIAKEGLVQPAAAEKPSFIGYIAEGTGQDGVPELVIAFRGTSNRADWETDLLGAVATAGLYGDKSGKVHRGFFNLIHGTPDDVEEDINPAKTIKEYLARSACDKDTASDQLPRIITTGHSLGGALALVAAVYIAHEIPGYRQDSADYTSRKLQTYTFAAPRIGDRQLAEHLSSAFNFKAVQVKNTPDVVPYAPPAGLRDMWSLLKKLPGMRARAAQPTPGDFAPAAADDAGLDQDSDTLRWKAYNDFLKDMEAKDPDAQIKELESFIADKEYEWVNAPAGDIETADTESLPSKIRYLRQLLTTVLTKWSDSPAPDNGLFILDVRKSGRWGGQNHSLEVYCDNLNAAACSKE